jgi:hypothetical protein
MRKLLKPSSFHIAPKDDFAQRGAVDLAIRGIDPGPEMFPQGRLDRRFREHLFPDHGVGVHRAEAPAGEELRGGRFPAAEAAGKS